MSYVPAGTSQVAIAVRTISANKMVYADGSLKPRRGATGVVVAVSAMGLSCGYGRHRRGPRFVLPRPSGAACATGRCAHRRHGPTAVATADALEPISSPRWWA